MAFFIDDESIPVGEGILLPDDVIEFLRQRPSRPTDSVIEFLRPSRPQPERNWDFQTLSESPLGYFEADE